MSTEEEQVQKLESLLARRTDLLHRQLLREIKAIEIKRKAGIITQAEEALEAERIKALEADRIVGTWTFKEKFCNYYAQNKPVADSLDSLAELACEIIILINPLWMAEPTTAYSLATLGGARILKGTVDVYCSGVGKT